MIDLRRDTVTRPTHAMRAAMARAEVGDDVYGDDPTVNRLEERVAAMTRKEAALFMPSGTQSNLAALMSHCARGDEYLVGQDAHAYRYEAGGAAVLGSIQPQPIENAADGSIPLAKLTAAVKPDDDHFARTRLVCLEDTIHGRVLSPAYVDEVAAFARERGLALHLDGARAFNAAVASGRSIDALCAPFDSVSLCLSKGLGAPAGSMLCGSTAFIAAAHRSRKMLGGGLRQAGVLAAAGLHAIEHHVDGLAADHEKAARLAEGLASIDQLEVDGPHTNMVFVTVGPDDVEPLQRHVADDGIVASIGIRTRFVLHRDVDVDAVDRVVASVRRYFTR